jgi:GAF domain-containing protein
VHSFTDKQIELAKTFAAQAVIAIENVRLFHELQARNADLTESLDQQTATSEILRVIASSPTDLQPVMDVVAENAARFCGAANASIWRLEGESLRLVATHGALPLAMTIGATIPVRPGTVSGRAVRDRRAVHLEDILALSETEYPEAVEWRRQHPQSPTRTLLVTPLLREGVPIGVIHLPRGEVQPFTDKQIALAKTFAAQAVIAIENVRLFNELQTRNRELTEALEQQTATGEILKVISGSPTDVQPVFATIVESALRLCDGLYSGVYRLEGDVVQLVAHNHVEAEAAELLRGSRFPLSRQSLVARAILDQQVVHVSDMETDPEVSEWSRGRSRSLGYRSILVVPMLREGIPIGAIRVNRSVPGPFSAKEIALL